MMDQTHLGYASWNQPPVNVMPAVKEIQVPGWAEMGISEPSPPGTKFSVGRRGGNSGAVARCVQ